MCLLGYISIPAAILTLYTLNALTGKGKHNNDGECQHQAWEEWNSTIYMRVYEILSNLLILGLSHELILESFTLLYFI